MNELLKTAMKAKMPLIAIRTDDPRHIVEIIEKIMGDDVPVEGVKPVVWKNSNITGAKPSISTNMNAGQIGAMLYDEERNWSEIGQWCQANKSILIVINPASVHYWMTDVGFVSMPKAMISDFVIAALPKGHKDVAPLVSALSGLSMSHMHAVARMACAEYGEFTSQSVRKMRKKFFQVIRGLEETETKQLYYSPPDRLVEWLKLEGKLFKPDTHPLLTPRGFLFKGPPGTGKTSGAKYLAENLNVPLYRLDMGMILSKWLGESDQHLMQALQQADSFAPCVLLMDEVEKLFEVSDGSGVMPRLLGYLLWWLQEHQSKVLVVMTTNNESKIPPELYRAGRVDEVIEFTGLLQTQMLLFMYQLADKLEHLGAKIEKSELQDLAEGSTLAASVISQSKVTEQVLKLVKLKVINQTKETVK